MKQLIDVMDRKMDHKTKFVEPLDLEDPDVEIVIGHRKEADVGQRVKKEKR